MDQKSILIVDDDNLMRLSLASLLRSEGVETRTASTLEEAEMLLETERFDLARVSAAQNAFADCNEISTATRAPGGKAEFTKSIVIASS